MGLDTSHGCWHGPYSMFMRWRIWLAKQVGIPLMLMEGFYGWEWDGNEDLLKHHGDLWRMGGNGCYYDTLTAVQSFGRAVPWSIINDPLKAILHHSDCDGRIKWSDCLEIAKRLGEVLRTVEDDTKYPVDEKTGQPIWSDWREGRGCYDGMVPAAKRFIKGLMLAFESREDVTFR